MLHRFTFPVLLVGLSGCLGSAHPKTADLPPDPPPPALRPIIPIDANAPVDTADTRLQLGEVEVVGGDVPDAAAVAATMVPRFRDCQLRWAPDQDGEVRVSAKVGPSGEVRMATPESHEFGGMLVACVAGEVAGAQFATPSGQEPVVVIHVRFTTL
jgi:hypothetical protein